MWRPAVETVRTNCAPGWRDPARTFDGASSAPTGASHNIQEGDPRPGRETSLAVFVLTPASRSAAPCVTWPCSGPTTARRARGPTIPRQLHGCLGRYHALRHRPGWRLIVLGARRLSLSRQQFLALPLTTVRPASRRARRAGPPAALDGGALGRAGPPGRRQSGAPPASSALDFRRRGLSAGSQVSAHRSRCGPAGQWRRPLLDHGFPAPGHLAVRHGPTTSSGCPRSSFGSRREEQAPLLRRRPLAPAGILACFAVAAWTPSASSAREAGVSVFQWFVACLVFHDLIAWPPTRWPTGHCSAPTAAASGRISRPRLGPVPWANHIRSPAVISAVWRAMFFPFIFRLSPPLPGYHGLQRGRLPHQLVGRDRALRRLRPRLPGPAVPGPPALPGTGPPGAVTPPPGAPGRRPGQRGPATVLDSHTHAWRRWPYAPLVPDEDRRGSIDQLPVRNGHPRGRADRRDLCPYRRQPGQRRVRCRRPATPPHEPACGGRPRLHLEPTYHRAGSADRLRALADRSQFAGFTHYVAERNDGWLLSDEADAVFAVADRARSVREPGRPPGLASRPPRHRPEAPNRAGALPPPRGAAARDGYAGMEEVLASASVPNLFVKVSGFHYVSQRGWDHPWPDAIAVFRRIFDAYGPQRLCWESDFSASARFCTFRQSLEVVRQHCTFLTGPDLRLVLGETLKGLLVRPRPAA